MGRAILVECVIRGDRVMWSTSRGQFFFQSCCATEGASRSSRRRTYQSCACTGRHRSASHDGTRDAESRTRAGGVTYDERRLFFRKWANHLERTDPFYTPHLAQNNEDLSLR